ncbi:MAG: B12-binding domain-containing radical SAM protein [Vulcanimicrobiota bacterium]
MKVEDYIGRVRQKKVEYDVILVHIDSFYNLDYAHFNMGLLYIATLLREKGYKVKCLGIHELFYLSLDRIRQIFTLGTPEMVGFYTLSDNIYQVQNFAKKVKQWVPGTKIVVGGPLATSWGVDTLKTHSFDICVVGEGENAMLELANYYIKQKGSLDKIESIIFRKDGEIVCNQVAPPIIDLDLLPFPDPAMVPGQRNFHIVSGRGCPYNCVFCFQGVHGLKYRYREAEKITQEIIYNIETSGYNVFDIIDDTFISNPERVRDVARRLARYRRKSNKDFAFFCQGRVDIMEKNPEMLPALKEAGLIRVQVGMESGDPEILKVYNKKITTEQVKNVVEQVFNLGGMTIVGNFILGGPFESERTFDNTLEFVRELISIAPGVIELGTAFMGPYPGTPIAESPEDFGLKTYDDKFKKGLTLSDVHMTTEEYNVAELRNLERKFSDEVLAHMKSELKNIPREMIKLHLDWERKYGIRTFWNMFHFSRSQAIKEYFRYLESPRFRSLFYIPLRDLPEWYPLRVIHKREYSNDGKDLILPSTVEETRLSTPEEILIYELSSGKLTVNQMLEEFKIETSSELDRETLFNRYFIPTFAKLDDLFLIVFYK